MRITFRFEKVVAQLKFSREKTIFRAYALNPHPSLFLPSRGGICMVWSGCEVSAD